MLEQEGERDRTRRHERKAGGCDQRGEKAGEMRPADRRQHDRKLGKIGER